MKKELLSPVGNMESLYQAIHNGADAVYLGGKQYGARMFSDNFTKEELINAINYCHLYGVKIYITINTIVFNDEISDFLQYVEFIYNKGVDAVIMQDLGMISLVKDKFPDLEIHASTQMHNYNQEDLNFLEELGVKRVVLARELSLSQIQKFNTTLEKEIFIHGALCVSFSGCCLFSSMTANRSGNRGECNASCRLDYELYQNDTKIKTNGKYLLSPKELCTIPHFKEIMDSDVTSLKIEGRMKSPEYVGLVTKIYRKLMEKYYNHQTLTIDEDMIKQLKTLFNRDFTSGYLFNESFNNIMNIKTPNHIGIPIGETIEVNNKYIKMKLNKDICQEDGIRFTNVNKGMIINKLYNSKGLLVNQINKGDIAIIDNKVNLTANSPVSLTTDSRLLKQLLKYQEKKIDITIKVEALISQKLKLTLIDHDKTEVTVFGNNVLPALTKPVNKENITRQLSKLGGTPFQALTIDITSDDNIFISLKELNELRRLAVNQLIEKRIAVKEKKINIYHDDLSLVNLPIAKKISMSIMNEDQLKVALNNKVDYIYTYSYNLYQKYKHNGNIFYRIPRVCDTFPDMQDDNIIATNLGSVHKYSKTNNVVTDYFLNIVNNYAINYLIKQGVKRITISPEAKINMNFRSTIPLEMIIYGRIELMISKYCPLKMLINNDNPNCHLCKTQDQYYLKNNNNYYPIRNSLHYAHIMDKKNIDLIKKIKDYNDKGISCFRIELFDEKEKDIKEIIERVRRVLNE